MTEPRAPERRVHAVASLRGVTRAAKLYSSALAFVGVATFAGVVVVGAPLPPFLPTVGLAAVLALCIGRVALYPGELAASAELAVLVCAVVAFRDDAPITGPLLLALLVGPLDRDHWQQRSFVRMAYNSGDRALASLGAVGAFAATVALLGSSVAAMVAATAVAALMATALDSAATVGLVVCLGGTFRAARRELLDVDALVLPLAVAGGAVGFFATEVGWWGAAVPLLALALVPELLQARARVPAGAARDVLLGLELLGAACGLALVSTAPSWPTIAVLAVLAVLVGRELVVDARVPVPPVLGTVVVLVAAAVPSTSAVFAGGIVAALVTATSWWSHRGRPQSAAFAGTAVGAVIGVAAALVSRFDAFGDWRTVLLGFAGAAVFAAAGILLARSERRREVAAVLWVVPLTAIAVVAPPLGRDDSALGLLVAGATLMAVVALAAWCGSTPWRSRVVSRRFGGVRARGRRAVGATLGAVGAATAVIVVVCGGDADAWVRWSSFVAGEAAVGMGLFAVRQWRFAPRARRRDATVLVMFGVVLAVVLAPLP